MSIENSNKKILILSGATIDRNEFQEINKKISRDRDIKNLISKGKRLRFLFINIFIFAIFLYLGSIDNWSNLGSLVKKFKLNFFAIAFVVWQITEATNWIKESTKQIFSFFSYFKYAFSSRSPRNPLELWSFHGTNISDAQAVLPTERSFAWAVLSPPEICRTQSRILVKEHPNPGGRFLRSIPDEF